MGNISGIVLSMVKFQCELNQQMFTVIDVPVHWVKAFNEYAKLLVFLFIALFLGQYEILK